jgi:very-short-patch-repair endonuclease
MSNNLNEVVCQLCQQKMKELTNHIFRKHNVKAQEYKKLYPGSPIRCESLLQKQSNRMKGEKNIAYQHDGRLSPFSDKFFKGTNKVEETKVKAKLNKQLLNKDTTKIEYWLEKTKGDLIEAKKLLSQRQSTFSLTKCISKYGEENGRNIWLNRQEKWHNNFKKSNFSKISQDLFWNISKQINNLNGIYFAQLNENKEKDLSGANNELRLKLERIILPDFIDAHQKKIIEFDGTYWHGKIGHGNKEREQERNRILIDNEYKILHINESDYNNDKQGTITKCLNFLTQ